MENYEFSQACVPFESALHPIECDPKQTQCNGIFNVRIPIAIPGDLRLYDIGRFSIATQGMQAANINIGELWVTYKVCLLKPRLTITTFAPTLLSIPGSQFVSGTAPFGSAYSDSLISISGASVVISPNFVGAIQVAYIIRGGDVGSRIGSLAPGPGRLYPLPAITGTSGPVNSLNSYINNDVSAEVTSGQQTAIFLCPGGLGNSFVLNNNSVTQASVAVQSIDLWVSPWAAIPNNLILPS